QQPIPFMQSHRAYYGENQPRGAQIDYVLGQKAKEAKVKVMDVSGRTVQELTAATDPGYHRLSWDPSRNQFRGPGGGGGGGQRVAGGPKGRGAVGAPGSESAPPPNLTPLSPPAGRAAGPGMYRVVLTVDGTEYVQTLTVEPDPNAPRAASTDVDEWGLDRE